MPDPADPTTGHFVVGTAGHIDHGKTSLIRALTGVDLDRLPEERDRGITIALGFTHLDLPGGRTVSFVDVPGHERLVRTMIAGATGLDAVLLCVSAVEGVMPQTREHLDILQLLQVQRGIIALTMTDLVDEEMLELATMDVEEAVAGTFLEGAPILHTAAGADPQGIDALRIALDGLPSVRRPETGPFRLPVDRAFVQRGFGTVVTGTVRSGQLNDGEEVEVQPAGIRTRVRGLQVHGDVSDTTRAGLRTALNLAGVERHDLARGMVVVRPGELEAASVLDARYRQLSGAPPLKDGDRVRLLAGTAEVMAVVGLLGVGEGPHDLEPDTLAPGQPALIQLRTEAPLLAMPKDRFVLRRESPVETLGGGTLLDPWAPRTRRRSRARTVDALERLEAGDRTVLLERAGDLGLPPRAAALRVGPDAGIRLGESLVHPTHVARLRQTLLDGLDAWHVAHPLAEGVPRRELHRALIAHVSPRAFDDLVSLLRDDAQVVLDGPSLRRSGFAVRLTPAQAATLSAIEARSRAAGLEGPKAADLLQTAPDYVGLLMSRQRLIRVADRLLHADLLEALTQQVRALITREGSMDAQAFKGLTGLSRRHAIPLLEWMDAQQITQRRGDVRVLR